VGAQETRTWRYAIGMFGTSIPINMLVAFMAFYYTDVLRVLTTAQIAGVLLVYAIIDAVDNPVYGYLSDRTRTRWGRRRPWLVVGAPLLGLGLVAFFAPPDSLDATAYLAWFACFAILTETADSLINTNYGSLLPELFPDEKRRAQVNALRQGFGLVALAIGLALTPTLAGLIGYPATALAYAVLAVSVILVMATGATEDGRRAHTPQPRFLGSVRAILGTGSFWLIAVANGLYAGATALLIAGVQYYVTYRLELAPATATVLLGTVIVASALFLLPWSRRVHRHGPVTVWRTALVVFAVAFVPLYFANSLLTAAAAGAVIGLGFSGVMATADLVVARFIDTDAARTGQHREGMIIAAFGFFNRLNALLKSLGFILVFAVYGFANANEPGPAPGEAARFLTVVLPCVLTVAAAVVSRFVRLPAPPPAHGRVLLAATAAPDDEGPAAA
jgi:GPH family glycoside/pentoside/hexuronide:cation symporter